MNKNNPSTIKLGYICLIALNVFLLSPLLHSAKIDQGFIGVYDPVVLWNILCSAFFLLTVHLIFKRPFVLHLIMVPLYLTTLADLYLIFFYGSRLSAGYLWIVLANTHDAADYIQDFLTPMSIGISAFLVFYAICLWNMRTLRLTIPWSRSLAVLSLGVLVVLYGGLAARQTLKHEHIDSFSRGFSDILEFDLSAPAGVFSQGMSVYSSIKRWRYDQIEREDFKFNASRDHLDQSEVYVFVIGESGRPDRLGINGYHRDTTPNLSEISNLISYTDVICEWPITQYSVPMMLSQATVEDFDRALKEKSIVAALDEAGFETHWLSNQPFSYYGGFVHVLADDADSFRYMNRVHDGVMLEALDEVLMGVATENRKTFIVIHSLGSHQSYTNRYPPEFAVFKDSGDGLTRKEQINNAFDNSVLYTDFFLSQVIDKLEALDVVASLTYVSDHGENLLDDERQLLGHGFHNEYDFPTPMLFWYSDRYMTVFPEKIDNARNNSDEKIITSNVFYSIADMASLDFESFLPEMSFFSDSFAAGPRIVYNRKDDLFFDYDAIINVRAEANGGSAN